MSRRYIPNIIITGTPGCGKTSHAEGLVAQLNEEIHVKNTKFQHFSISDIAKERKCIDSYDEVLDTSVVDEDKLLDSLEPDLEKGGIIVDWHCCEIFPERLIDLVVVLRTDNSLLFDRLKKRDYKDNKIQENLDCEIMEVIAQEARDSYIPEIVIELGSNTVEEMEENIERIFAWTDNWVKDHEDGVTNELDPEVAAAAAAKQGDSDEELD
ncbi:P-loop containing nucleoside triphosphate hydrolase protein [Suhomyces tanzawaensis NRRL Y-17324]|uniref:Adenylate kinase isoenzyme 6 homolog n=1 Tax=Suhomyces tanzawaensis NRRL Y-17324 TaxID=984487 RepID=A0A1E4SBE0_9ASCO|nr:P-loop containing nucleoside triphosphate hydrolase protein [Suhomyces tanzawaensis NRRL Y-17324]ODV76847.1 P-loop containing nucleoside triphosphate hydrolase protein [Suhomyces tanzawaensis NRRL Y-17324]